MSNEIAQYGLQVFADYTGVKFPPASIAFSGEGKHAGQSLILAGTGRLLISGDVKMCIEGSGVLDIVVSGFINCTIVHIMKPDEERTVRISGDIDGIARVVQEVQLARGASFMGDVRLRVSGKLDLASTAVHAPHSTSSLAGRFILEDGAKAIARGGIVIGKDGAGSRASERLHALLLGTRAEADLLPTLSVANDDVTCNHAATVGHADPSVLYYLQSRGLTLEEAKMTLAQAFLSG